MASTAPILGASLNAQMMHETRWRFDDMERAVMREGRGAIGESGLQAPQRADIERALRVWHPTLSSGQMTFQPEEIAVKRRLACRPCRLANVLELNA
jgi:hypothetical protein